MDINLSDHSIALVTDFRKETWSRSLNMIVKTFAEHLLGCDSPSETNTAASLQMSKLFQSGFIHIAENLLRT